MGLWISLSEASYSIENNTSVVNYAVYMSSNGTSWNMSGSAHLYGGTFGTVYVGFSKSTSAQLLLSGSTTVAHNSDGTGSWSASTYYYTDTSAYGTQYASASITLTTIPRASTMTAPSSMITGTSGSISISQKSSSFSHVLSVYYKDASGNWESAASSTITVSAGTTSVTYTPEASLFEDADFAALETRTGKFSLQTYSGSTAIGSAVTKEFTLTLQQNCKPSTPTITFSPISVYTPVSGGSSYYLKDKSNITMNATSIMVVPSGETVSGSIYKYTIDIGNQHLEPTASSTLVNYTLPNPIDRSGSVTLTVTAYDTRGRSTSYSGTVFTVYDYSEPSATITFEQNSNNVNLIITGSYYDFATDTYSSSATYNKGDFVIYSSQSYTCLYDDVTGAWDASKWRIRTNFINQNAIILQYKIQGASTWTTIDPASITFTYGAIGSYTATASFIGNVHDNVYIIQTFLRDNVGYPTVYSTPTAQVVTGKTPISFLSGGEGIKIGGSATASGFRVAEGWDAILEDSTNGDIDLRDIRAMCFVPIGTIVPYGGSTVPSGWLECNGAAINRTTYSQLFAKIGTLYGTGDGSTTFNLPDLRGRMPQGAGTLGSETYTQGDEVDAGLPNIEGTGHYADNNGDWTGALYSVGSADYIGDGTASGTQIGLDASRYNSIYGNSTTVQPNTVVIKYIIKANNVSGTEPVEPTIEQRIAAIETQKVPFSFGVDSDGNYGYFKSGADTVTPFNNLPFITSVVYGSTEDPISYTYTATDDGHYLAMAMSCDGGGSISSTGTITWINNGSGRIGLIALIHVVSGQTITLTSNNYSAGAYRGACVFLLKINRSFTIKSTLQSSHNSDGTTSLSKTITKNNNYLLVTATCGSTRSMSYSYESENCRSDYSTGYGAALFIRPTKDISLSANSAGYTAGGANIYCYQID